MKTKYILLIILIQLIFSCTSNNENNNLTRLFNCKEKLNTGEKKNLIDFKGGLLKTVIGDSLVLFQQTKSETMFTIYRLNDGSIKSSFGLKGNGPGELILPRSIWFNTSLKSIIVYDMSKRQLFTYHIDSVYNNPRHIPKGFYIPKNLNLGSIFSIAPINDTLVLCSGMFEKGVYELLDQKNIFLLGNFGKYPETIKSKGVSNFILGTAFQGELYAHPLGQRVVYVATTYGAIEFLEYKNRTLSTINSFLFHTPIFNPVSLSNGAQSTRFDRESKNGFVIAKVTNKYIYALYSGRTIKEFGNDFTYGRNIYVFDWNGNPIKCYELNRDAISIAVDTENKYLYVLFLDKDYSFEKFQLSGL